MPMERPGEREVRELAEGLGLAIPDEELAATTALVGGLLGAFDAVEALPDHLPPVRWPREGFTRPGPEENPLGAWVVRTNVRGAAEGPLAGRTVALKDNVALAGVPMSGGTDFLADYVPPVDATIVERILDAGGTIVGKATCEYLSASGGSHTAATGPVHNPHRRGHSAGGSSSGSAALVANGDVDLAIGGDQGGSIRIPSALCGTVGMKPTFGLVPYTGVLGIEPTIDHVGPITRDVADNALFLEVLAGTDGIDPRQLGCRTQRYSEGLGQGVAGLRIALLEEGFAADAPANASVERAAGQLAAAGAKLERVSVPEHVSHAATLLPAFLTGTVDGMLADAVPSGVAGLGLPGLPEAFARWRETPASLPGLARVSLLASLWAERRGARPLYARAHNQRRRLRASYDAALEHFDCLLMPTCPGPAAPLPPPDAPTEEVFARSTDIGGNTGAFDLSGHPALSVPCGRVDGLPVGMMLVGRHWDEWTLYRVAHAFEQAVDWRDLD